MIKKIVIVGGGTSGWMTAASIVNKISNVEVVLVDKEVSTPVGVGEATLLQFDKFMEIECGFDRNEWIKELDAIPKSGILFPDWGDGKEIWHPFYFSFLDKDLPLCDAWTHTEYRLESLMVHHPSLFGNLVDLHDIRSYAYHIDCSKLVKFIRSKLKYSVTSINSEVKDIKRDDNKITQLILSNGDIIDGDFFFDCTGFNHILRTKRETVNLLGRLFCDTAIAGHVDYIDESEINPYVTCPAVDHGWVWQIPLQTRIGTGLVFNRSITSIDEAKEYFKNYWSGRIKEDSIKVIDWTPYYDKNMWEGNVISIGLSAGFIEPLESTGIALITEGISKSVEILSGKCYNQHDADLFNAFMKSLFEDCVDFVSMHYDKSVKDTKFWRFVRESFKESEQQITYIKNMEEPFDPSLVTGKPSMFGGSNWIYWLIQLGYPFYKKEYLTKEYAESKIEYFINYKNNLPMNIMTPIEFVSKL